MQLDALKAAFDEHHSEVVEMRGSLDGLHREVSEIDKSVKAMSQQMAGAAMFGGSGAADGDLRAARKALAQWARTGKVPVSASMTTSSNPDGGFLVPDELDKEIQRILKNITPFRNRARVVQVKTANYSKLVGLGGAGARWSASETSAVAETANPTFAQITPPSGQLEAEPRISQMLLDDNDYDVASELVNEIADAFSLLEGAAYVTGDGVGKPRGFLTLPTAATVDASRPFGTLQFVKTGVAAALNDGTYNGADAIIDLVYSLKAGYRRNGAFMMNSATAGTIRKFKDAEGRYLWQDGMQAGSPATLFGYPVEICEDMPDIGANAFPVAFGDWQSGYVIADRFGMRLLQDPYTAKPWVKFYATRRVGGHVLDSNAIKLLKVAA